MAFQQGLSGLNAASRALDVTSNNVANAATVGFKSAQTHFSDVFANTLNGSGASAVGIGVSVNAIAQQFTQGNITATNNPLDISINGNGFFRMATSGGDVSYSRNGQFHLSEEGFIVDDRERRLTGYQAANGVVSGALGEIQIDSSQIPPRQSSTITLGANLDSRLTAPAAPLIAGTLSGIAPNYNAPTVGSYNSSTSLSVYDSLGNPHVATYYFVKAPAAVTVPPSTSWNVLMTVDNGVNNGGAVTQVAQLTFDGNGQLTSTNPAGPATLPLGNIGPVAIGWDAALGVTAQSVAFDFSNMSQWGSAFSVDKLRQDGYSTGSLAGINVGKDGVILGNYSNGEERNLGQVALANFANPNGLASVGNNQWEPTSGSGPAMVGAPNSGRLGVLQSSAVEESNVDLTAELVNMITQQRNYQSNAQSIKTQDQIMQTLVNLR